MSEREGYMVTDDAPPLRAPGLRHIYPDYQWVGAPRGARALCGHVKQSVLDEPREQRGTSDECIVCTSLGGG